VADDFSGHRDKQILVMRKSTRSGSSNDAHDDVTAHSGYSVGS